jgi:hypothetical protein
MYHGHAPSYLCDLLPPLVRDVTNYPFRNRNDRCHLSLYQSSFIPSVINLSNSLDNDTRNTRTFDSFKINLKSKVVLAKIPYWYCQMKKKRMIMKFFKKEWFIWKFWKKGGSREKGGGGNEVHAPCACDYREFILSYLRYLCFMYSVSTFFRLIQYKREGMQLHFHISRHIAHLDWETPVFFTLFTLSTYGTVVSNCF